LTLATNSCRIARSGRRISTFETGHPAFADVCCSVAGIRAVKSTRIPVVVKPASVFNNVSVAFVPTLLANRPARPSCQRLVSIWLGVMLNRVTSRSASRTRGAGPLAHQQARPRGRSIKAASTTPNAIQKLPSQRPEWSIQPGSDRHRPLARNTHQPTATAMATDGETRSGNGSKIDIPILTIHVKPTGLMTVKERRHQFLDLVRGLGRRSSVQGLFHGWRGQPGAGRCCDGEWVKPDGR
jgi:hypothetical protein